MEERHSAHVTHEAIDITEKQTAPNSENVLAALEAFSYTVSHDLRTPLRAIHGFAEALKEECSGALDGAGMEYVDRIVKAARRMDTLIEDILRYSQAVNSNAFEPVPLQPLITQIIEDLRNGHSNSATFEIKTPLFAVLGSKCLVTQCLQNLISNAVKFTAPGQPAVVKISSARKGRKIRIVIEDNGIGISPEFCDQLFQPFHRESEGYEGTGVGLSIVKKAAERMAGRIGLESTPGKGTTFWIELFAAE